MTSKKSIVGGGWNCSKCTFYHHSAAARCVMCNELRVSKEQMRDFIRGKAIPDDSAVSPNRKLHSASQSTLAQKKIASFQKLDDTNKRRENNTHPSNSSFSGSSTVASAATASCAQRPPSRNPYQKKTVASSTATFTPATGAAAFPTMNATMAPIASQISNTSNNLSVVSMPTKNSTPHAVLPGVQLEKQQTRIQPQPRSTTHQAKPAFKTAPLPQQSQSLAKTIRPVLPFQPGPVPVCLETSQDWIYPNNDPQYPKRQYQFLMTQSALFHNTLVSLPTGLGKTLIAAVVLYNYYRWFPSGKVIFMAPTLPLVHQQVEACYNIMGIPASDTAVLTGKMSPERRREVWGNRRVFFCTPQTVQKDLDAERVDAQRIVCVVLDEAHKAAGDFAYCKIVQQLEAAGAKFRLLGLSATPGTTIKKIQLVVDALRINKVEARQDTDPDVKQYIHDRQTEEIIVNQSTACKGVERILTDLIAPLLNRLRLKGAMGRVTGNATLTHYTIVNARNIYVQRTGDYSLHQVFAAAGKFVKMRDDLHKQGIGVVRSTLERLRREKQQGELARIVKEETAFQNLWELVWQSTADSTDASLEDKVRNNPKLSKLKDILMEHFERARLNGESSRAIVFSQLRDSVSEIVGVLCCLRPTVRPRQFVGQAKSAANEDGSRVKGMTQAEQQQTIKQFRDDVFNVLVCTCIGEEGLDIGEVDLIVNFDCLKSPIRMIQRVGRTGRKRSGRVVTLVAEGLEQNALNQNKQLERNLALALRRPQTFKVSPTVPLLPNTPVLNEKNMGISKHFRMSQVEGHGKSTSAFNAKPSTSRKSKDWRLSDDAEIRRAAVMGSSNKVFLLPSKHIPQELKKQFLLARKLQQKDSDSECLSGRLGRVSLVLKLFENGQRSLPNTASHRKRRRALNEVERYVDAYFPLFSNESSFQRLAWGSNAEISKDVVKAISPRAQEPRAGESSEHNGAIKARKDLASLSTQKYPLKRMLIPIQSSETSTVRSMTEIESISSVKVVPTNASKSTMQSVFMGRQRVDEVKNNRAAKSEEWLLPTPPSSSDEESNSDDESGKLSPFHASKSPGINISATAEDNFSLPSQESSSDESDSKNKPDSVDSGTVQRSPQSFPCTAQASLKHVSLKHGEKSEIHGKRNRALSDESSHIPVGKKARKGRRVIDDSSDIENEAQSLQKSTLKRCDNEESQDAENPMIRSRAGQRRRVLEDSPSDALNENRFSLGSRSICSANLLVDTQDSPALNLCDEQVVDDIVCGICSSGESPDEDPIVLCDGPGGGLSCEVAVHTSCYSVSIDLSKNEDWRCYACQYKYEGGTITPRCFICHQTKGPLSRFLGSEWIHQVCRNSIDIPGPTGRSIPTKDTSDENADMSKRRRKAVRAIRKRRYGHLFDEEARIDSEEDPDGDEGEEDLIRDIEEEEEFYKDFINDSTQLGYTQDELDRADPAQNDRHRALDAEEARKNAFATPILNRQMALPGGARWSDSHESVPSSLRGLGQMHFIRSVIEHHRQGGDADDIEEAFHALDSSAQEDESNVRAAESKPKRKQVLYDDSDSD